MSVEVLLGSQHFYTLPVGKGLESEEARWDGHIQE